MDELINLADFEAAALARLPAGVRDYYRGGANDEVALRENRAAWERWQLHYRVLRDVAERDLSTTVPGATIDWPVMIARAEDAGCSAIAVTVDAPGGGQRQRDLRNAFAYPLDLPISNLLPNGPRHAKPDLGDGGFMGYVNRQFDASPATVDVLRALSLPRHEFDVAMALAGCRSIADVDRSLVARIGERPRDAVVAVGAR